MGDFLRYIRSPVVFERLAANLSERPYTLRNIPEVLVRLGEALGPAFHQSGVAKEVVVRCFEVCVRGAVQQSGASLTELWNRIRHYSILVLVYCFLVLP